MKDQQDNIRFIRFREEAMKESVYVFLSFIVLFSLVMFLTGCSPVASSEPKEDHTLNLNCTTIKKSLVNQECACCSCEETQTRISMFDCVGAIPTHFYVCMSPYYYQLKSCRN